MNASPPNGSDARIRQMRLIIGATIAVIIVILGFAFAFSAIGDREASHKLIDRVPVPTWEQ